MKKLLFHGIRFASAASLGATSFHAFALDLTVQAGYQAEYTDNAALAAEGEDSTWIHTPQVKVTAAHEGRSVSASTDYYVSRQMYQDNTFGDQTAATGTALLTWRAISERLRFDVSNISTQTTIDSRTQNVPTNQQVTNTATAGTTLTLDGPTNDTIDLHYDYAFVTAQHTDTDSRRQTGTASYIIPISPRRRIQLNASVGDVNYDSSQSIDYVSQTADLQFVSSGDRIELDTRVGYTVLNREQQTDDAGGTIGGVSVIWHASLITTVNASYSRSLQDQSADITSGTPDYGQTFTDNSDLTTPYTLDATSLGVSTQVGHNKVDLRGYLSDQNYDGSQDDQNTKGVALGLSRALRPTLSAQMYVNYSTVDFKDNGSTQDTYESGLRLNWTRWRNLAISAGTAYTRRTSDVESDEYKEWAGTITLLYTLLGTRR